MDPTTPPEDRRPNKDSPFPTPLPSGRVHKTAASTTTSITTGGNNNDGIPRVNDDDDGEPHDDVVAAATTDGEGKNASPLTPDPVNSQEILTHSNTSSKQKPVSHSKSDSHSSSGSNTRQGPPPPPVETPGSEDDAPTTPVSSKNNNTSDPATSGSSRLIKITEPSDYNNNRNNSGGVDIFGIRTDDSSDKQPPPLVNNSTNTSIEDNDEPSQEIVQKLLALDESKLSDLSSGFTSTTLALALKTIRKLNNSLSDHKDKVSRLQLQNRLLSIQTNESAQRYQVENNIVKREVERLKQQQQQAVFDEEATTTPAETYRRRLCKAKVKLRDAEKEVLEKDNEIDKLKHRLREGRIKRDSLAEQAQQFHAANFKNSSTTTGGLETLGILASQVLSQNNSTTASPVLNPTASIGSKSPPSPEANYGKRLMSPVDFGPKEPSNVGENLRGIVEKRRRDSSASTVTVPSDEEQEPRAKNNNDPNETEDDEGEDKDDAYNNKRRNNETSNDNTKQQQDQNLVSPHSTSQERTTVSSSNKPFHLSSPKKIFRSDG